MRPSHLSGPEVSTLGKYQLIANLGHGGMADVYLAVVHGPVGFNKLTVIKRLRPSLAEEPEFLAMFLDEARLAARLNHPNVVQTNEVAEVDGLYYIAMEYLDGQPLNRVLHKAMKSGELPRNLLLRVVADALAGMHHAHELADYDGSPLSVVHRDASPHNIFVTYDGQTKVVDFGIAKAATRSAETRGGVLKGKIAYMAPEQARSEDVDRRADIYAMGLVMWEALTGARLRKGSDLEMLDKIGSGDVPPLQRGWPECPDALAQILRRATALAKDERYASANDMRQDILAYLDTAAERVTHEEVGTLVSALFENKRVEMKAIIERQLTGLRRAGSEDVAIRVVDARRLTTLSETGELPRASMVSSPSGMATPSLTTGTGAQASASLAGSALTPTTGAMQSQTSVSATTASPTLLSADRSGRLRAPIVIVLAGVFAAVTVLALRRQDAPAGAELSSNGAGSAGVVTNAAAHEAPTDSPAPARDTVKLRLLARPEQAKMFLDNSALQDNPFSGYFKKDSNAHTLRIEAEGYLPVERSISFASDQTVEVALERTEVAPDKPAPVAPVMTAPVMTAPAMTAPAIGNTAVATAAPTDTPPRPNRPKKQLDGDDPWE